MGPTLGDRASPVCYAHPETLATATCFDCLRELCSACTELEDLRYRCLSCARTYRSRQRRQSVALGLVGISVVSVLSSIGGWVWWTYEPPFDYGEYEDEVRRLTAQSEDEPCDRQKILALTELLVTAGDNRSAIERSESFFAACGEFVRLRWLTYEAHKRVSEWDLAAAEATKIIEDDPWDADYRWWRGFVYEQKGDNDKAVEDYRQAIALRPQLPSIPLNLAGILEKQGKPCEALLPIEQMLFYYPQVGNVSELRRRTDALSQAGSCRTQGGGSARIRFDRQSGSILTRATINGRAEGTFVIDTGASYVTLGRAFAEKLGVAIDGPGVLLATASGRHTGTLGMVDEVDVKGLAATSVPVVVIDGLDPAVDGLLGLSYLARFDLVMSADEIEIRSRSGS